MAASSPPGERELEDKKLRMMNEVPGIATALIVVLVIVRRSKIATAIARPFRLTPSALTSPPCRPRRSTKTAASACFPIADASLAVPPRRPAASRIS